MNVKGYPTILYIKDIDHFYKFNAARTEAGVETFLGGGYESVAVENFGTFDDAKIVE